MIYWLRRSSPICLAQSSAIIPRPDEISGLAVQLGDELWVVHAFQKKSTQGIKTPKHEIELIKDRLKRLKEMLR